MTPAQLILSAIYYIIVGILSLFSIFGVYILIRYGRSTPLALSIAVVYSFFFLKLLISSYQVLGGLLT